MWVIFSLLAALCAGMVIVLSKAGLKSVDASLGFAIETVLIVTITWIFVSIQGGVHKLGSLDRKSWLLLIAAGILTTASSLFSFHSLKLGVASRTGSVERLSLVFSIVFSVIFLKDKVNWQLVVGGLLMVGGAILVAVSAKQ